MKNLLYEKLKIPYTIKYAQGIQQVLFYEMWRRPNLSNNNTFTITFGDTGSGKSWGDVFFGWCLDVDKKTDEHRFDEHSIVFNPLDFIKKVKKPNHIGEALDFEELEIDANSKESFKKETKILGKTMSLIRSKRQIIFFNLPSETQLSAEIRRLSFGSFQFKGVAPSQDFSNFSFEYVIHPKKADSINKFDKYIRRVYPHYIKKVSEDKDIYKMIKIANSRLYLPLHRKDFRQLIRNYERAKKDYQDHILDEFADSLMDTKDKEQNMTISDYIKEIEKNKEFYLNPKGRVLISKLIEKFPTMTVTKATLLKREYNNKQKVNKDHRKTVSKRINKEANLTKKYEDIFTE